MVTVIVIIMVILMLLVIFSSIKHESKAYMSFGIAAIQALTYVYPPEWSTSSSAFMSFFVVGLWVIVGMIHWTLRRVP